MLTNEFSDIYLSHAAEETRAARKAATKRMYRLLEDTFEDGGRAIRACAALLEERGIEGTLRVLASDGLFGRHWHFGWMRGGLLAKGNRGKALEALRELPDAIRSHYELVLRERDLSQALTNDLNRADNERLRSASRRWWERDRSRER